MLTRAGHFIENSGLDNKTYTIFLSVSPRVFHSEYPDNPQTLGEAIRKARTDKGLLIRELGELAGADEMTIIHRELNGRHGG